MKFPKVYPFLEKSSIFFEDFALVPIRYEDRFDIMKWRNEQIYHLRQSEPLTKENQDKYFKFVVAKLFIQEKPNQILFSFLKDDICIGYGGLVHISWIDKHAEISFIMDTSLEKIGFHKNWSIFLSLIEEVAFKELFLHKIFVYAFDLRPHLYETLKKSNYFLDARLIDHCYFDGGFKDVIIYSKLSGQ
ncbi:GNAT family N-acetyltransferase [Flagellimonas halotolerans]|uniref:GNAT family N-acetyltransferase n=1 Tax=Flagellimonas halotolerans TaxID=3112164 RepID=A0ABU6ILC9_9FLAO|nr:MULTISPECIES: GNAT family N-acetyltransferase [unclassified Allomuricauda]MEC3963969.1 GNAT family N-acetyltransferase [Muricauda sp. SYSU M86414]MEC4263839.1 GNAT family N-acetyltransferase [Muricauda sp. SYSU M84420]